MGTTYNFFIFVTLSICLADLSLCNSCQQSLKALGHTIRSNPTLKSKNPKENDFDNLPELGEEINQLILDIKEECQNFDITKASEAAEHAFGPHRPKKCLKQFVPFFSSLFNPDNHLFEEEERTASHGVLHTIAPTHVASVAAHKAGHAGLHVTERAAKLGLKFAGKYGKKAAKAALHDVAHAPHFYSTINKKLGGKLDLAILMGSKAAGGAIGGAIGLEFAGVGELIGGPLGGFAGGTLGKMAVALLHCQDGEVTQEEYNDMPEECKEGYDAKLEQQRQVLAKKVEEIFVHLPAKEKAKVEKMSHNQQRDYFAKKIEEKEGKEKYHIKDEAKIIGKDGHKHLSSAKKGGSNKGHSKHKKSTSKSKKKKLRLLSEEEEEKSPFEHPALDIAYRLVHACSKNDKESIMWFNQ